MLASLIRLSCQGFSLADYTLTTILSQKNLKLSKPHIVNLEWNFECDLYMQPKLMLSFFFLAIMVDLWILQLKYCMYQFYNHHFFVSFHQDENNTENAVSSSDAEKQDSPPPKPPRTRRQLTILLYAFKMTADMLHKQILKLLIQ